MKKKLFSKVFIFLCFGVFFSIHFAKATERNNYSQTNHLTNPSMEDYSRCPNYSTGATISYATGWQTSDWNGQLMVNDSNNGCVSPRPGISWQESTNMPYGSDGRAWLGMHSVSATRGESVINTLEFPLESGVNYTMSFDAGYVINSPYNVGGKLKLYGITASNQTEEIGEVDVTNLMTYTNPDWQEYILSFTPENTYTKVKVKALSSSTRSYMYFDDFRLYSCHDQDGDTICDAEDNCPTTFNKDQVDSDNDTIGDVCDNCPNTSNKRQRDDDNDGIGNKCDVCPDEVGVLSESGCPLSCDSIEGSEIDMGQIGEHLSSQSEVTTSATFGANNQIDVTYDYSKGPRGWGGYYAAKVAGMYLMRSGDCEVTFQEPVYNLEIEFTHLDLPNLNYFNNFSPAPSSVDLHSTHTWDGSNLGCTGRDSYAITTLKWDGPISTVSWSMCDDTGQYGTVGIKDIRADNCVENPCDDSDGDSICDEVDNCPDMQNSNQADTDNDSVGDVCDNCPDKKNTNQADNDNDTIGNKCDNCPDVFNKGQNDSDNDGVGNKCDNCPEDSNKRQLDDDGDGIGNACDECPNEAGEASNAGCPECPDQDEDGICDTEDNCPEVFNQGQADDDGDGIGNKCDECPDEPGVLSNAGCPKCPDQDEDGICDVEDNCPEVFNQGQADNDGDGIGNKCDVCPDEAGTVEMDGCPEVTCCPDTDEDGICDEIDPCPNDYGTLQNMGCPDGCTNDQDEDGICDADDNCIAIANEDQSDMDNDGMGDVCDACPNEDGEGSADGCPEACNVAVDLMAINGQSPQVFPFPNGEELAFSFNAESGETVTTEVVDGIEIIKYGMDSNDPKTITYTFSEPVENFQTCIYDIDKSSGGRERVKLRAKNGSVEYVIPSNELSLGASIEDLGNNKFTGTENSSGFQINEEQKICVNIAGPITEFTIECSESYDTGRNFGFSNPTFSFESANCENQEASGSNVQNDGTLHVDTFGANTTGIELFPNPADGFITLRSDKTINSYKIYNVAGKYLRQGAYTNRPISVKGLSSGVYFIMVDSGESIRFIKK